MLSKTCRRAEAPRVGGGVFGETCKRRVPRWLAADAAHAHAHAQAYMHAGPCDEPFEDRWRIQAGLPAWMPQLQSGKCARAMCGAGPINLMLPGSVPAGCMSWAHARLPGENASYRSACAVLKRAQQPGAGPLKALQNAAQATALRCLGDADDVGEDGAIAKHLGGSRAVN